MRHKATQTYGLGSISSESSNSPFRLPMRMPAWYPDGVDAGCQCQRLFLEEGIGKDKDGIPKFDDFPFRGSSGNAASSSDETANLMQWVLGTKIPSPPKNQKESPLTKLMREAAKRARKYNASLYRLRRFHFRYKFPTAPQPAINPHGGNNQEVDPGCDEFKYRVSEAEADWVQVNENLNRLFDDATCGLYPGLKLRAAEMITKNNYILSIRLVAVITEKIKEVVGSSSQGSINSPFSSSQG